VNRVEAAQVLGESLARPSATPCTWREDRDSYIREEQEKLRACLVEPKEVEAVASAWAQQYCAQSGAVRRLTVVARSEEKWLLYEPGTGLFSLAHGAENSAQPLSLLGFSSTDALAEWLG
jgi:hypothetical protein